MNRFEIRDILNQHKEHFRVLPILVQNELNGIISAVNEDKEQEKLLSYSEWEQVKLSEQKIKTIKETAVKKKSKKKTKGK